MLERFNLSGRNGWMIRIPFEPMKRIFIPDSTYETKVGEFKQLKETIARRYEECLKH